MEVAFVCPWGGDLKRRDYAIVGTYDKKQGWPCDTYVFLNKAVVAHVDADLVRTCKFSMLLIAHSIKGGSAIYKLSQKTRAIIEQALQEWWA